MGGIKFFPVGTTVIPISIMQSNESVTITWLSDKGNEYIDNLPQSEIIFFDTVLKPCLAMSIRDVIVGKVYSLNSNLLITESQKILEIDTFVIIGQIKYITHKINEPIYEIIWIDCKGRALYDRWQAKIIEEKSWKTRYLKD